MEMIRVTSSFADGPVNFNPTGPVEDQTQKLISSTDLENNIVFNASFDCQVCPPFKFIITQLQMKVILFMSSLTE